MTIECHLCERPVVILDYADKQRLLLAMAVDHKLPICQDCYDEREATTYYLATLNNMGHTGARWAN